MYYPSKYNHLIQSETGDSRTLRILSNLFFGASDIVNEPVYQAFLEGEKNGEIPKKQLTESVWKHFVSKGYVWDNPEAEQALIQRGAELYGKRDLISASLDGGMYGFITSLHCNLACPYCFQRNKAKSYGFLTPKQVDFGLKIIAECEKNLTVLNKNKPTTPKISITGGEPLLQNKKNITVLEYLIEQLVELNWPYSITTNGTELAQFVANHKPTKNCRNIQITLDGPKEIHNKRRYYRNGRSSFNQIIEGLEVSLSEGWPMALRVNLDMKNVEHLPELARFVRKKGWCKSENFFAYASPITDHGNLGGYDTPKDEADLLMSVLQVAEKHPHVRDVFDIRHFRGLNYVERMLLKKDPRYPVIHRCEAVLGMYIFDPLGDVHSCLEAVGDSSLRIGTYDPELNIEEKAEARWSQRHVLNMEECSNCKIRFICAGGCTMDSINHGDSARCMPFLREMDIAWQYYARTRPDLFP